MARVSGSISSSPHPEKTEECVCVCVCVCTCTKKVGSKHNVQTCRPQTWPAGPSQGKPTFLACFRLSPEPCCPHLWAVLPQPLGIWESR